MTNSPVDDIKNKLDLVDLISGYIRLQKAGRNYRALCPFHSEKTPSFMVSPERQLWRCFGCNKGGSIFDFVMEIEGVEFGDALRILAQRTGVELKKIDPKLKTERTRIYEICHLANQFFIKQLEAGKIGKKIQKYLAGRGLETKTIKDWQIGYAPNQWRSLKEFLSSRGYPDSEILKAGLIVESEKNIENKAYDRFRDRIMFPIRDLNGIVVGFTGRENPDNPDERMGKYINTPNTLIYDKSRILYGLDRAKLDIKQKDVCILVEGQMDVIMSHQARFNNVVASSGTALTEWQLKILKRYTENLGFAFDMDLAGEIATKRGLDLALQAGFNVQVVGLSDSQDPADAIQKDSSLWAQAVNQAQGLIEFYLANAFNKNDSTTAQGKKEITKSVLPIIKQVANKVEQAHWLQELARRIKVQEVVLIEEMNKIKEPIRERMIIEEMPVSQTNRKVSDLEEYTIGLILSEQNILGQCRKEPCYIFANSELGEIFNVLKRDRSRQINLKTLKQELPAHLANRIDDLAFQGEAQKSLVEEFEPKKEIRFCFNQLKKRYLKEKLNQLNLSIQEAENKKDKSLIKKLIEEFNKLSKQITLL